MNMIVTCSAEIDLFGYKKSLLSFVTVGLAFVAICGTLF